MKRTTKRILCAALILAACLTSGGCDLLLTLDEGKSEAAEKPSAGHLPVTKERAPTGLTDVASLDEENGEDVVCFYVTVLGGTVSIVASDDGINSNGGGDRSGFGGRGNDRRRNGDATLRSIFHDAYYSKSS